MSYRALLPFLSSVALLTPLFGQSLPTGYVDPMAVIRTVSETMGVGNVRCLMFSGLGYAGKVGQNVLQSTDWPLGDPLENYSRTINYEAGSSIETFTRPAGKNPRSWKHGTGWLGGTPLQAHEKQTFAVNGKYGWHIDGQGHAPVPAPVDAELWQLDIWLNPVGFIKAAMKPGANPKAIWRWEMVESGRDGATTGGIQKSTILSITVLGKYRVNATVNSDNLIQRVQTWVPHPVLGDMNYEHEYTQWQDIDGAKVPGGWHHHDGWDDERQIPILSGGHNGFGGTFADIRVNDCGDPVAVPAVVRTASSTAPVVEARPLGDGIWLMGGGSHNSVAVEFKNFIAVVEAPLDEARSLAVIEKLVELIPNKPIRYVVNTHDHFDHLGGLRTYLHVGATVITHQRNRQFYEVELLNYVPRTLNPDMVSLYPPTELSEGYTMEDVDEKYVISDGDRNLDVYYAQGLATHVEGMLMAYLPKEKILIEADLFDTPSDGGVLADSARELNDALLNNVRQIGLDIDTVAPIHGAAIAWSEAVRLMKR
jgi:glyoxylase-like metal-dependent hydrolase (beta-lactamase superfamily II)